MTRIIISTLALLVAVVTSRPEPPVTQYLPPNQQYGPPQGGNNGQGVPSGAGINQYLPPNGQYGVPDAGPGYSDESNNSPAKYEFEYMVNDAESGNDFGHKESRDGDMTRGVYYVLLPDGRRQTVEYEADQDGYRPKVSYTQEGPGIGSGAGYPDSNPGYRY